MSRVLSKLTNSLLALTLGVGLSLAASPLVRAADDCLPGFTLVGEACEISFTFSDGAKFLEVPQGLGPMEFEVLGAAGGAGGLDGPSCSRAFGGEVGYLVIKVGDLSNKTIRFYPGDKGKDGASGARGSGGGAGGVSLLNDQFQGGRGGNTGSVGSSGGGGGGGAASVLDIGDERFVAAGGGAGGGCANSTNGSTAGSTAASYTDSSNGGSGLSTNGNPYFDGGGGGGGGGGIVGGTGGQLYKASGNESAGFGGNAGKSTAAGNQVEVSTFRASDTPGKILARYFPVLGTKSIEPVNTVPNAKNAIEYKLTLKSNRAFTANDVVLSGTASTWQPLTVTLTSARPTSAPYDYTFTVSPRDPRAKLTGTLVATVFDLSARAVVMDAGNPEAKLIFNDSTLKKKTKTFDVSFSESVQGLTKADFSLLPGTATSCQLGPVTGEGYLYRVSIVNCPSGFFGLSLNPNAVIDSSSMTGPGTAISSGLLGKYLDEISPVGTVVIQPGTLQSNSHIFDVRFDEAVTGITAASFAPAVGTSTKCQVGYVVGSGRYFQVSLDNCTDGTFGLTLLAESASDKAGNLGPEFDVVSELSEQSTKATIISVLPGQIPEALEPAPATRFFSELDPDTQAAIQSAGIFAPSQGAPTVTVLTDLSNSTLTETIQLVATEQVEVGSLVRISVKVSPEMAAASDVVAFLQTGDLWQYLGRTSFVGTTANSADFTVAKLGQYKIRVVIIGKDVVTNMSLPKASGFGRGLSDFSRAVNTDQTLLSSQQVDLTLEGIAGANGVPTVVGSTETSVPGAQTDENAPSQPYDPLASPEGINSVAEAIGVAVVISGVLAGAVAGAVAGASAGSRGGSSSSSSSKAASSETSSQNTDSSEGEISTLDAEVESFTTAKVSWGDRIPIFKLKIFTFLDRFTHDLTVSLAKFSPVISKIVNDGAYLRSIFGSMWLAAPITGVVLAMVALAQPSIELRPPTWELFLAIAVLGMFDAFSGMLATVVYSIGMISIYGISDLSDVRLMLGVLLMGFGPALIGVAFRAIRKQYETSFAYLWDRLVDIAVLTFFIGWSVSAMVATLPALAGRTLVVANYTNEFAIFLAVAIAIRILLEELAARGFSKRLDTINPTEVPSTSQVQKVISTGVRLFLFIFVTAAFMGNVWQVWVGSLIFILPNILSWFQDKFPNYPWLWRLLPQGVPGLALTLIVSSLSGALIGSWLEGNPEYPQYLFMLLPIPVFLLGLLGMFGREGNEGEDRPIMAHKWRWVYRIGGIGMLLLTMNLAGVLVI